MAPSGITTNGTPTGAEATAWDDAATTANPFAGITKGGSGFVRLLSPMLKS